MCWICGTKATCSHCQSGRPVGTDYGTGLPIIPIVTDRGKRNG